MLTLPTPPNTTALRTFWLLTSAAVGLLTAAVVAVLALPGDPRPMTVASAATIGCALPGLARPSLVWPTYRAWNWLARQMAGLATRYLTGVAFFTVVWALSRSTSPPRFESVPSAASMWRPRGTQTPEMYPSLYHDRDAVPAPSWTTPVWTWMRSSRHPGSWALMPLLWLAHVVNIGQPKSDSAPRHIYTLY